MRRASAPRRGIMRGMTLIELMVALAIAATLVSMAAPSFNDAILSMKLSGYSNNLVASTMLARGEAIKRNAVVSLCVSSDGATCGAGRWEQGWIVMCNTVDHAFCDAAGADTLVIQAQPALAAGWKISEANGRAKINFDPTGSGATGATLTVCRAAPTVGVQQRAVRISASGRPSVAKTASTTCI
jgi:type IV fimbrial biogenesis protein FimT